MTKLQKWYRENFPTSQLRLKNKWLEYYYQKQNNNNQLCTNRNSSQKKTRTPVEICT